MIGKHMILPVSAIILSLIFQLTYTWRTFFLIYSNEDYVELARAKGLRDKIIEKKYILRPSMPFVITSFSLTLVGFWQMTIALEHVFNWPGIGQLYIGSLPNFWQEAMFPGEMTITVSLVVLFAYLLGSIVFALDIFYALADPRVEVVDQGIRVSVGILVQLLDLLYAQVDPRMRLRYHSMRAKEKSIPTKIKEFLRKWNPFQNPSTFPLSPQNFNYQRLFETLQNRLIGFGHILKELRRYPSAIIGLVIILMLVSGSLYALIALPYSEIGASWYSESVTGKIVTPKLAQPEWMNFFRKNDLLATLLINQDNHPGIKSTEKLGEDLESVFINFEFDYPYAAMPEEIYLNIIPKYKDKRPFVVLTWFPPDGREIPLKGFSAESENQYSLTEYIPRQIRIDPKIVAQRPSDSYGNYLLKPLFGLPDSTSDQPVSGPYRLQVEGMLFEEDSDLDAEFLALGQVYGLVGTDIMRRDLLIPLVWGMPFALLFGLGGAAVTTVLAMIIAATGTWFGGWVDGSIQRLNEAVMILPVLALAVLLYAFFDISIWTVLVIMVILNIFGSPAKAFRAALIQVRESPYVEAAQAYGASNYRIIIRYMIPRIIPVLIPQLIVLIPSFVFLEATLGLFNINLEYPTWGQVIYEALKHGVAWGSRYWVLEPIALLLLTGFSFAMLGFALDQILNPKLKGI
jgi:peptide/nickel transport system permease protein